MFKNLKIGHKLAIAFAIVLILNGISCGLAIRSMRNINNRSTETFDVRVLNLDRLNKISEQCEIVFGKSKLVYIARNYTKEQNTAIAQYNESKKLLTENLNEFISWVYSWDGTNNEEKMLTSDVEKKLMQH